MKVRIVRKRSDAPAQIGYMTVVVEDEALYKVLTEPRGSRGGRGD